MNRRHVLAGVAGLATAGIVGAIPRAHAEASLAATLNVVADATDETGEVATLWLRVSNDREHGEAPIDPVVQCWAMERQTQLSWTVSPADAIAPGESRVLVVKAPGDRETSRLPPGNRGLARLWDRGTDASAHDSWEVGDP